MKKGTIIALIVAIALIIIGGILLALGLSDAMDSTPESTLSQLEVSIQQPFENIQIDTADCNVTFAPYKGTANAHVVIMEKEQTYHNVWVENNTLKIEMIDERQWQDYIGVNWESMEITVYLPEKQYESVWVVTDTGEIRTPAPLSAEEIILRSSTGEIDCDSVAGSLLDCMTATGDIQVRGCAPTTMKAQSSTGDISLYDVQSAEIHLQNSTGETVAKNVICQTLTCNSSTGSAELQWVTAEEYLQVFTTTGDVDIGNGDAGAVNIETDTGDVRLPADWEAKDFRIETDTGDIRFK